jgi:hypothetical protein
MMDLRTLLENLMAGAFICPVTNDSSFNYLSNANGDGVSKINAAMAPFDRELAQLPDNSAFYLVTTDVTNKADKLGIRKHFEECRDLVEPVVSFIVLISRVKSDIGILTAGQIIRFTELLSVITSNDHHIQQLNQLMTLRLFKTSKQGTDEKLKALFKGMVDIGILVEKNSVEMLYQATGKLDYIYQVMEFIADHESIEIDEGDDAQAEMPL